MINSVIIPLIKNKCGDQTDKNNYRPIALSSIISKVFEHVIAERLEVYLWTNDNQFGFKSGHSTDLCIYALTEYIEYFKSRSTSVYVAFLDASKAFDKISHWTLFRKLIVAYSFLMIIYIILYNLFAQLYGPHQHLINTYRCFFSSHYTLYTPQLSHVYIVMEHSPTL